MKRLLILSFVLCMATMAAVAQIKIGDNPQNIDPSSLLELESSSRVLVISKVSTLQMETIAPQRGGMVYNTDTECIHYYDGAQWVNLCDAVSFTLTNDPIENLRSTIAITQTQGNYNLEVATNSIRTEQIADGGINGVDIQDNSIGRNKLGDAAVGPDELATESVDSDAIIDGTILPRDFAMAGPSQVLATTINGVVAWQNQNELYELTFDKDSNTLTLNPATGTGSNSINLEALVGSDDQTLTLTPDNRLQIENGNEIDLSFLNNTGSDNQTLSLTGNVLEITGGNTVSLVDYVNTDNQQLSITGNRIELTDGGFVDLPPGTVDTDEQDLSLDGTTINITDGDGVDLEPLIETVVGDNGYLTAEIDGDETNELQDLNFDPVTNILTLSTPGTPGNQADLSSLAGGGVADGVITNMELQGTDLVVTGTTPGFNGTIALGGLGGGGTQDLADVLANGTSAGNNQINDLLDPTLPQDAATQNYVETRIATILGAGGADGVVTTITPTATGFDVIGSNGGFNGSIDLDANFVTETELASINIVSTDTPNAITTGLDGGALYNDTPITIALTANTAAIATLNTNLLGKEDAANKSTDGTLADNSDIDFPTEQAVKTYVDAQISSLTGGSNMANDNLVLDATRIHDLNGNNLVFNDNSGLPITGNIGIGNLPGAPQSKLDVAGQIQARQGFAANNGTLGEPSIGFYNDPDTGLYRPVADEIRFAVGEQEAMRMEEDGGNTNVTIFQSLTLENLLLDKDGDTGTAGQILSSTGTQTDWIDAPTVGAADWSTLTGIPAGLDLDVTDDFDGDWASLANRPAGLDDGDDDTVYTAGAGITISGANEISFDGGAIAAGSIPGSAVIPDFGGQNIITGGTISSTGNIITDGDFVDTTPDYVFQKYFTGTSTLNDGYTFKNLSEIEQFVKQNNHLPGVQSFQEIKAQGFWNLGEASRINLEKIEELFLHTIEQEKKIETLQEENEELTKELKSLKSQIEEIKQMLAKENE